MRALAIVARADLQDGAWRAAASCALSSGATDDDLPEQLHAGAEIVALEGGVGLAPQRGGGLGDLAGFGLDLGFELDRRIGEIVALERLCRTATRRKRTIGRRARRRSRRGRTRAWMDLHSRRPGESERGSERGTAKRVQVVASLRRRQPRRSAARPGHPQRNYLTWKSFFRPRESSGKIGTASPFPSKPDLRVAARRVGHKRVNARLRRAMGARLRPVPTRFRAAPLTRGHGARDRARGDTIRCSACAFAHPTNLAAPHFFLCFSFFFLSLPFVPIRYRYSLFAFSIRHPDEGMAERRQAPGCCEHPVVRAMTGTRAPCFRRPAFPAMRERPPLGAPPWRFCGPGLCLPLSGIPSGIERRPHSTPGSS